jgi:TetR/AcrR family transcriptional regulator, repressor for neighboring sulfatase
MPKQNRPYGKEEVKEALIQSAATLFSEKGVDAVSLRMIADHAGVNHGLIHRHFGSKEILRRETQEKLSADVRSEIGEPDDLVEILFRALKVIREHDKFWRVMARTLLDDKDHAEIQRDFPFVKKLVERVASEQKADRIISDVDAKSIVASFLAYGLGMMVFKGYILPAVDLDGNSSDEVIEKLNLQLLSLFTK